MRSQLETPISKLIDARRYWSYRQLYKYIGDLFLPENRDDRFPEPVVDEFVEKKKVQEARLKQVRKELGMA